MDIERTHRHPYDHIDPDFRDGVQDAVDAVRIRYEHGWQPMDVVHTTPKITGTDDIRAVARLVLFEATTSGAADRAPDEWVSQLRSIEDRYGPARRPVAADVHPLRVHSATWRFGPMWGPIGPLPSEWPTVRAVGRPERGVDDKMLARIRGLLAKAESTEFEEEAAVFTEKAQELMSRYSLSETLIREPDSSETWIRGRRFHIDNPYVAEKSSLLFTIAEANACRSVIFTNRSIVEAHGSANDLEQLDMLFTSLLVQATRAMAGARASASGSSTTSFRKGFLTGFAIRIGERLRSAGSRATEQVAAERSVPVSDLLPALAARKDELDAEITRRYPRLGTTRRRAFDAAGYHSGRVAADHASLGVQQRVTRGA
ncbi:DUF2786 domain-containing protein [Rhodococcoides trifolii]|nr:DUF2786 domain-containing protein [Rhodococcus trifolii]